VTNSGAFSSVTFVFCSLRYFATVVIGQMWSLETVFFALTVV